MARPGIRYLDVARAATQLKEQGLNPTVAEVRKTLNNTGSNSTISRHLREWEEKQGLSLEAEKGIPAALLTVVRGLYEALNEEASEKLQAAEQVLQQKSQVLEAKLSETNAANKALQNTYNQLSKDKTLLQDEVQVLQAKQQATQENLVAQKSECQALSARLEDRLKEIERLSKQITHAQDNLEHYRETFRQQRLEELQTYESKISKLERERDEQIKILSKLNCQLSEKNKEVEQLSTTHEMLKNNYDVMLERKLTQDKLMQKIQCNYDALEQSFQALEKNYTNTIQMMEKSNQMNTDLKIQMATLEEKLRNHQQNLMKAEDKVNQLQTDKLFLAQEKSELSKQVQMLTTP